jgi:OTU domain-containing protein 6
MVKKNKSKKVLSPSHSNMPDQPPPTEGDGELMDDLLAELDSRDKTVQHESANVLMEMQENQENAVADKAQSATKKQDSKSRHVARQVSIVRDSSSSQTNIHQTRKAAALAQNHAPTDADADARLEREAKEEEMSIKETCDKLGVQIHEVRNDV